MITPTEYAQILHREPPHKTPDNCVAWNEVVTDPMEIPFTKQKLLILLNGK